MGPPNINPLHMKETSPKETAKFGDSRCVSWEYNTNRVTGTKIPVTANPQNNTAITVKDTNFVNHISVKMITRSFEKDQDKGSPSPDIISSTSSTRHPRRRDVVPSPTGMPKSTSLTSLKPSNQPNINYADGPTDIAFDDPRYRPLRRSGSSQSVNLPLQSQGSQMKGMAKSSYNFGSAGASNRRAGSNSPKILTGTMETISNMIISRSGISPKSGSNLHLSSSSLIALQSSDGSPQSVNSVTNIRAMPDVRPLRRQSLDDSRYNPFTGSATPNASNYISHYPGDVSIDAQQTPGMRKDGPEGISEQTIKNNEKSSNSPGSPKKPELTKSNIMTSQVDSVMLRTLAGAGVTSQTASIMCMTGAKGYIMDKYFQEIAKSWDEPDADSNVGPPDVAVCGREYSTLNHQGSVMTSPMKCSCGRERTVAGEGNQGDDSVSLQDHAIGCCHGNNKDIRNSYGSSNLRMYTQVDDLIHLEEPLTEEALIKTLQARFYSGHCYTNIGPVLVLVNPLTFIPEPRPLGTMHGLSKDHLQRMVRNATRHQLDSGVSQTLLLSGGSGSGKTHSCMLLLRQLFDIAGGGSETDAFKHLRAAMTVLRALGSAATTQNNHSSRMGYMIENNIADGAIYRTKIHCYFIDQTRVIRPQHTEKNFHIFYQMLAGLSADERAKYHLTGHSSHTLTYLSSGDVTQDDVRDREHFLAWKNALAVLGIPFMDIMRVLAAIMLLGNIDFLEGSGLELEVQGENELLAVASLLGVTRASLYRGLCTRTRRARGQVFKAQVDPDSAGYARDCLAKALYCRLVSAIIKRANNTKRLTVNCANSTDSNDSGHNEGVQQDALLSRNSTLRGSGSCSSAHQTDSFIGVLDMFGFEKLQENHFEQLCVNLCAETLQHFYNTHMFRAAEEACAEEAITCDIDIAYTDNAPTIELLSSPRVGILSLLDAECGLQRGCPETLLQKVHIQHSRNKLFFEPSTQSSHMFGIKHFSGSVTYDARSLLSGNRNQLPDDIIATFTKQTCSFGFASHLFSQEIKTIQDDGGGPKGAVYRISPSPMVERQSDLSGSLSSDFHLKLDSILQLLVSSRPHFVRCLKSNENRQRELFEREFVKKQIRSLHLLETLHLMAAGFPHRWRYRAFNHRYQCLIQSELNKTEKHYEESNLIFDKLLKTLDELKIPSTNAHWALGKKHIFLSEGCRQLLEELRDRTRNTAATIIQTHWRKRMCQKKWPTLKRQLMLRKRERQPIRKHVRRHSGMEGVGFQQMYNGHDPVYSNGIEPGGQEQRLSNAALFSRQFPNQTNSNLAPSDSDKNITNGVVYNQQNGAYYHHPPQNTPRRRHMSQDGGTVEYSNGQQMHGSLDNDTRVAHSQLGPGRYSFHGNPRQSRQTMIIAPNQKPRSRSTERHYVSHEEYQRQLTRQKTNVYSSHSDLRIGINNNNHVQFRQGPSAPGSRHSQSSYASSGSGTNHIAKVLVNGHGQIPHTNQNNQSISVQSKPINHHSQQQNGVYSSHKEIRQNPSLLNNRLGEARNNVQPQAKSNLGTGYDKTLSQPNRGVSNPTTLPNNSVANGDHSKDSIDSSEMPRTSIMANSNGSRSSSTSGDLHVTFVTPNEQPPPVPASRSYTVKGNIKLGYPQIRIMKQTYHEHPKSHKLIKGLEVKVVGASTKRGFLLVEYGSDILEVPFHLTALKAAPVSPKRQGIDV